MDTSKGQFKALVTEDEANPLSSSSSSAAAALLGTKVAYVTEEGGRVTQLAHRSGDTYFQDEEGLVGTFEFDYEKIFNFQSNLAENNGWILCALLNIGGPLAYAFWRCWWDSCGKQNLRERVDAKHVCITQDGIKYVVDRHNAGCRCNFQQQGRISKTVPFDKITGAPSN